MYIYQYVLMAAFCGLLFKKETRFASIVFLFGWSIYYVITLDLDAVYYYAASATIETAIGFTLNKRYRLVSYLGYSLIIVNLYGFYLYENKIQPQSYDIIYAMISTLQILILITRGFVNGNYRTTFEYWLVCIADFDSRQARGTMYKNTPKKKTH